MASPFQAHRAAGRCDYCGRPEVTGDPASRVFHSEVLQVRLCRRCIAECVDLAVDFLAAGREEGEDERT
jgi:hypothetical protein